MCQYIKFITDCLLVSSGNDNVYNIMNPVDFLDTIQVLLPSSRSRYLDYSKANINHDNQKSETVTTKVFILT